MNDTQTGRIRALVVDDSEFFTEMAAGTLTDEHDIETSFDTSAEDALETLEHEEFDCIISDCAMPGRNGIEFLETVQDRFGDIPFILLTGRGDEEVASNAIAAGVSDYLLKLTVVEDKQYERLATRIENVVASHQTRKKYELLVDNSPDVIAQVSGDGTILAANPAMESLLGVSRSALVGSTLADVLPDAVAEDRLAAGIAAIEAGSPNRTEDHYEGQYFHNIFVPVDIRSSQNTFQIISRDITERKEREQALERQNERFDRFASVVSHDLRNPLNVAQNSVELMDQDDENIGRIDRSLDRIGSIIDDVLTLARQGDSASDQSPVDLETIVTDAWSYIDAENATLAVDLPGDDYLMADSGRFKELLGKLFRNSVEHSDGEITVTVRWCDDGFVIEDDGPGIPESDREDVFEPGYSTTRHGTGLGLSIAREIARAHDWEIAVSESDSGGARFEITGITLR